MGFLIRAIEKVTDIVSGHLQALLTLGLMALVMVDVVSRYVMQDPLSIAEEYGAFSLLTITCVGLAYTWKTRNHVRVEFIIKKLPVMVQRWLRLITLLLAITFTGFMVYGSYVLVDESFMFGSLSNSWLRTPLAYPQMAIVIGAVLVFLQLIVEIYKQILKLSAPEEEGE